MTKQRCGIIAVIGKPNAGKSTLINRMVGGKVSIVTPKAQTTRFNIRGLCMKDHTQLVLVDTPGIFSADKPFEKSLVKAAWSGLKDADAILLIIDARTGLDDALINLLAKLKRKASMPVYLAFNKVDKVKKPVLLAMAEECGKHIPYIGIFMISALTGDGVSEMTSVLAQAMPEGGWLYPDDQLSDLPMNQLAAEITREKIFFKLEQELPYSVHVEPESWEEEGNLIRIAQCIYVQKEGQKKIVLGKGGEMIKQIGSSARRELEKLTGKKIHLQLFVKVQFNWKENRHD